LHIRRATFDIDGGTSSRLGEVHLTDRTRLTWIWYLHMAGLLAHPLCAASAWPSPFGTGRAGPHTLLCRLRDSESGL